VGTGIERRHSKSRVLGGENSGATKVLKKLGNEGGEVLDPSKVGHEESGNAIGSNARGGWGGERVRNGVRAVAKKEGVSNIQKTKGGEAADKKWGGGRQGGPCRRGKERVKMKKTHCFYQKELFSRIAVKITSKGLSMTLQEGNRKKKS